ncbi:mechanosensitive ion channel domain-containing protein [Sphingobacterium sp. HMA12]|uniref:mechanosensitive ion channel domain-containing protein n=1 Tax=Sphingobacterium sp. HMA12 TaxID=2050894 RepID=UPI0013158C60|nr:mechanosensitive ion channel domain-containing protein [Sphingobacterium sp. HMA12]
MIRSLLLFFLLLSSEILFAQRADSVQNGYVAKMERFFKESAKRSMQDLEVDRAAIRQNKVLEEIKLLASQSHTFLKKGYDSLHANKELNKLIALHQMAKDGVFSHTGSAQSSRNLTVTYNILNALAAELQANKKSIDNYQDRLRRYRLELDSLSNDPSLFVFSHDSAEVARYMKRLRVVAVEISPLTLQLEETINYIQEIQNNINMEILKIGADKAEIEFYQKQLSIQSSQRNFVNIWEPRKFDRPVQTILYFSAVKAKLLLSYYLKGHWVAILLFLMLTTVILTYINSLTKGIDNKTIASSFLLLKRPFFSGLLIALCIAQFLFPAPPFILTYLFLISSGLFLSFVMRGYITAYWMGIWLTFFILFVFAGLDNLILQPSRIERWIMIVIACLAAIVGLAALIYKKPKSDLKEKWILYPIGFMVMLEILSIALNSFGRFNFSKVFMIAGLSNVVVCILFLWVVRLVNEGLQCASTYYKNKERRLFYLNYNRVGQRAPLFFYALLVLGWFVLFGRNFYEFRFLSDPLNDLLNSNYRLGTYQFSVFNLILFFFIISCATILSKIVSFFAADSQWVKRDNSQEKQFRLGSWILLIRIAIVVIGFFLAFSALGIPVEQIGLVIGALGVGIGFGLQTLVNNLVSGLILAFEKPVNVDDLIEIGGKTGKVKSIGFRSSVIGTAEGADLIMPNGDLLNAHVMNWSSGASRKRFSLRLEVRYGTDLDSMSRLVKEIFEQNNNILHSPSVAIQYASVSSQAVVVDIYFWLRSGIDGAQVKSDLFTSIHEVFRNEKIEFALPIQEIKLDNAGE